MVICLLVIASVLGINQYSYGMWNHFIAIPWLNDLINPDLYPNDPLIDQRENSPSFYNMGLAALSQLFKGNIALTHFVLYILAHLFTFISFFKLAEQLFKNQLAGLMALCVLGFSFPIIGGINVWDSILMERTIALPILIFSLSYILKKKWLYAVILQAVAFNIHPLSSLYVLAACWLGVIFWLGLRERYYYYWPLLVLLMFPVLYLRHLHPSDASALEVSELWMKLMYLRNAHHSFPSHFPVMDILRAAVLSSVYLLLIRFSSLDLGLKKFLTGFGVAVLIFLLIGTIFTEVIPLRIIIQIQLFRSFQFIVILTLIIWAGLVVKRPDPLTLLVGLGIAFQYFSGASSKAIAAIFVTVAAIVAIQRFKQKVTRSYLLVSTLFIILMAMAIYTRSWPKINGGTQSESWYQVQQWARSNSAQDAVFVESPSNAGFRVESQRSSYGTWHDGTKVFFSEAYGEEWWRRMNALGCTNPESLMDDYEANTAEDFYKIARELANTYSEVYVITRTSSSLQGLEASFQNEDYTVYQLD